MIESMPHKPHYFFVFGILVLVAFGIIISLARQTLFPSGWSRQNSIISRFTREEANPFITSDPSYVQITQPIITEFNPMFGPANAKLTIVEYSDLLCQYCQIMHSTIKKVIAEFPDKIRVVWKDLPVTSVHPLSRDAHTAARCAWKQKQFWPFADKIFENPGGVGTDFYLSIADELKLNQESFKNCLSGNDVRIFINYDIEEAHALQITATPYIFLLTDNQEKNQRFSGAVSEENLRQIVSDILRL